MKVNWKQILKIVITVLTALAGSLGLASCVREASPTPPEEGLTVIAENVISTYDENACVFREA